MIPAARPSATPWIADWQSGDRRRILDLEGLQQLQRLRQSLVLGQRCLRECEFIRTLSSRRSAAAE